MMKRTVILLMIMLISLSLIACSNAKTGQEEQQTGQKQQETGQEDAQSNQEEEQTEVRVVAGTVAAAQYLNALGMDVVGVPTTEKDLPESYAGKPEIGLPMTPSLELVLACEPDILVSDMSMKSNLEEMFYGQDVDLILLDNNSYDSINSNVNLLAEKLGLQDEAKELSKEIEAKKEEALQLAEGKAQPKVAVIFGTSAMFMLATDSSYTGSIVDMLGAENITDGMRLKDAYINFDREKIAELNPEVILLLSHADPEETAKAFDTEFENPFWQEIKAVQDDRVYELDTAYFGVTANFNSIDAPKLLAEMLYE